jgi:acetoacetyl-CoA synthetase
MTLVRQVRLTLGRDVDLETFLAAPTLDGLTAAARAARHTGDAPPVIRLAAGDPALPPVIFVHDAWGDLDVYWPAAQLLTGAGPVQGVRTDLHRADGSRRSIPELAEIEAEEIQRAVPAGPVRLIGHSFGGLMAYEIAGRLADAGREVDFVGLLDSLPPRAVMTPLERAVSLQAVRLAAVLPGLRAQPLGTVLHGHFRPTALPEDGRTFRESGAVYGDHVLRRYDGPVTYFRARRRIPAAQNMLRAWRRVAPRLGVVDIPGAHHDLLGEANVAGTAAAISRALARASCSSSTEPADTRRGT